MLRFAAVAGVLALLVANPTQAQDAYTPIEKRLTAEQLRATGLDQLSAAQLELLNRLLEQERSAAVTAVRTAERAVAVREAPSREPVESRITGTFRGWQPGTVLAFENGQQWRVTEGDLNIRAVPSPRVSVRPGMVGAWYLRVEGQSPTAKVVRVK